ncbi:MAG TPA: starch synthase, partial [Terriglobia bacterium]|nr:starch synthase [Terriglobia bacterium]
DTIENFNGKTGTGYKFAEYSAMALLECITRAMADFHLPKAWRQLMLNGMKKDFSWGASAKQYGKIYETLRREKVRVQSAPAASN